MVGRNALPRRYEILKSSQQKDAAKPIVPVKEYSNVLREEVERLPQHVILSSSDLDEVGNLIQQCLEKLKTIPSLYELKDMPTSGDIEDLQLQLRIDTLKLSNLLTQLHLSRSDASKSPPSPTLSATTFQTDLDSMFDTQSTTFSSRSSVIMNDDIEYQAISSRAIAREIILSLQSQNIFGPPKAKAGSLTLANPDLRLKLRQIFEDYFKKLRAIRENQLPF